MDKTKEPEKDGCSVPTIQSLSSLFTTTSLNRTTQSELSTPRNPSISMSLSSTSTSCTSLTTEESASNTTVVNTANTGRKRLLSSPEAATPQQQKRRVMVELPADEMPLYKTARNLLSKYIRATHRTNFFKTCLDKNLLPNGFRMSRFPRNIALNTGAFKAWEDTLISASRTLLEISHSHNQTVMNSLESAYFSAKTKALNTLKDNTSRDNIEKALDRIQTRLDGSLSFRYTAKLKAIENDPYSPRGKRRHTNKQPQLNRTAPNRRRGLPNHRGRRGRRPTHQTYNRRLADNSQHSQSMDNSSFSDKNVQNFFNAFSAFNNLLKNQNNNANVNNTYEPYVSDFVINLSHFKLGDDHLSALEKGLGFAPTTRELNMSLVASELEAFCRRLRLKEFFQDTPIPENDLNSAEKGFLKKFRLPSKWSPPSGRNQSLEAFIHLTKQMVLYHKQSRLRTYNLTPLERSALKELQTNPNIVIKAADKGSAIVILNSKDYKNEAMRQLTDDNFYIKVHQDLTEKHLCAINTLLHKLHGKGEIPDKVFKSLLKLQVRTARFYLLPKVHKSLLPEKLPGRPIISGNDCASEKISCLVDEHIKPFVKNYPSFVKDTTDFINEVESLSGLPRTFVLATLDVTSLYTNIPNQEGLTAVARVLNRNKPKYRLSNQSLCALLKLVLHSNNFTSNGEHYLQIGGTAMGTKVAPSYANIFMGELEAKMLETAPIKPFLYLRYIDIFLIWTGTISELKRFHQHCNSFHKTIKFTIEFSEKQVSFLDTLVIRSDDGRIIFDLFSKLTDKHC